MMSRCLTALQVPRPVVDGVQNVAATASYVVVFRQTIVIRRHPTTLPFDAHCCQCCHYGYSYKEASCARTG